MDFVATNLLELIQYRELLVNLLVRDLKVRYKNSALGFLWSLGNPLLLMLVFTVLFTVMMPNNQIANFPVFILIGVLPWNLFSSSVMASVHSIVGNENLVKKVYFPRELLPISAILSNTVNFLLALSLLFVIMLAYRVKITPLILWFPVALAMQVAFMLGLGLLLACLNVFLRDTEHIMEIVLLAWFFLTPVFYDIRALFPQYERLMYILNPMASFISTYRLVLLFGSPPDLLFVARTAVTSLAVLALGYIIFARYSPRFAEEL